jgi:hypothetical protein
MSGATYSRLQLSGSRLLPSARDPLSPSQHDNRRQHGSPSRLRMRGVLLRYVHREHWRVKSIAHSLLGCYTILFAMSIYLKLNCPHRRCGVNRPIFIISVLLYLSCSTHFALEFSHFYIVLVCATPYSSYAIPEHPYRIPQASRNSQTRQTHSLAPISSSQ